MIPELDGSLGMDASVSIPLLQQHAWNIIAAANHFLNLAETRNSVYPTPARTQQAPRTRAGPAHTPGHQSRLNQAPVIDLTSPTKTSWIDLTHPSISREPTITPLPCRFSCRKGTRTRDTPSFHYRSRFSNRRVTIHSAGNRSDQRGPATSNDLTCTQPHHDVGPVHLTRLADGEDSPWHTL